MENNFAARPSRQRSWWFRGGVWAIEPHAEDIIFIDRRMPEEDIEPADDELWLCVNKDESFTIDREADFRHKYGFTHQAWTYRAGLTETYNGLYFPLESEPDLYLSFASLGKLAWESLGGNYLSEYVIENEGSPDFLSERLKTSIVDFHVSFGPPYMLWEFTDRAEAYTTSVHPMLRQAQLIDMLVEYQRVATGQAGLGRLKNQINSVRNSEQENVDLANATARWNWQVWRSRLEGRDDLKTDDHFAKYLEEPQIKVSKYSEFDLNTDAGVIGAVERAILDESTKPHALGGLVIEADLLQPTLNEEPSGWQFTFRFTHLLNVIWYQAMQAVMRKVLLKRCQNDTCPKPDGLFVASRPNQVYCDPLCRNNHNVRSHRIRKRLGNSNDLLP